MHVYAIGLGSNRRSRHGSPAAGLIAAIRALAAQLTVTARSTTIASPAMGPAGRRFANAAILVRTPLMPEELLLFLKRLEREAGRRPARRWGPRPLDLDILFWSGDRLNTRVLTLPHPGIAQRRFVLDPLATIAPGFPVFGPKSTVRHLRQRLTHRRPRA